MAHFSHFKPHFEWDSILGQFQKWDGNFQKCMEWEMGRYGYNF
jgi:hypothetical protein